MAAQTTTITVEANVAPALLFIELFKRAVEAGNRSFDFSDLGFELLRVEQGAAVAGKLIFTLYPSDAFLRFAAATLARDFNL